MRMSYSYKPLLILALLHNGKKDGSISIQAAADFFRAFYTERKSLGLCIEKKKCIYLRDNVTHDQIMANIISNPVKALVASGFFFYNEETQVFSVSPDICVALKGSKKSALTRICNQKLKEYYK